MLNRELLEKCKDHYIHMIDNDVEYEKIRNCNCDENDIEGIEKCINNMIDMFYLPTDTTIYTYQEAITLIHENYLKSKSLEGSLIKSSVPDNETRINNSKRSSWHLYKKSLEKKVSQMFLLWE